MAYELVSLNAEIKLIIIDEGYFTEEDYPFTIESYFSKLGRSIEVEPGRGWQSSYVQNDTSRVLICFTPKVILVEFNLSDETVDKLSFEKLFREPDTAHGIVLGGNR